MNVAFIIDDYLARFIMPDETDLVDYIMKMHPLLLPLDYVQCTILP